MNTSKNLRSTRVGASASTSIKTLIVLALALSLGACGDKKKAPEKKPDTLVAFFAGAELQVETKEQKANLAQALNDAITLPVSKLKTQKYRNYTGQENSWDFVTLINKHFVPASKGKTFGASHYAEIKSPEVQKLIKALITTLKK